mgnify:CR=1 FL=1
MTAVIESSFIDVTYSDTRKLVQLNVPLNQLNVENVIDNSFDDMTCSDTREPVCLGNTRVLLVTRNSQK